MEKAQVLYGVYGTIFLIARLSGHVEKHMSYSTFLFFNPAEHGYSILFYLYLLHNHVPFGTDFG